MNSEISKLFDESYNDIKLILYQKYNYELNSSDLTNFKLFYKKVYVICTMVEELTYKNKGNRIILEEIKSDFIEWVITFFLKLKKSIHLSLSSLIEHTLMYIYYKDHFIEVLHSKMIHQIVLAMMSFLII